MNTKVINLEEKRKPQEPWDESRPDYWNRPQSRKEMFETMYKMTGYRHVPIFLEFTTSHRDARRKNLRRIRCDKCGQLLPISAFGTTIDNHHPNHCKDCTDAWLHKNWPGLWDENGEIVDKKEV